MWDGATGLTGPCGKLDRACTVAGSVLNAWTHVLAYRAALPPNHPDRDGLAWIEQSLHAEWLAQLGALCRRAADGPRDMVAKAGLLSRLIERDETDQVVGSPALMLAASLADDVLAGLGGG